jgi:multimeric flavodoxin WrbA
MKRLKVVGINGSPKKDGNTALLIRAVFQELEKEGIETELIQLGGQAVRGCMACYKCAERRDGQCINQKDNINECIVKMAEANGIILGSPTYYADVTAEMKAFIDRAGIVGKYNGYLFRHKAGAALTALNRGGAIHTLDTMNHFMHNMQMFLVGSTYWNMVFGMKTGEVAQDEKGMENLRVLGQNMAFLLQKLQGCF